jgi:membrane protein required for colicin V production
MTLNPLNPLDWLLVALLLYSAIRAAINGFFREAFTLAGLVLGFPLACWYYQPLSLQIRYLITTPAFAQVVAFALILTAVTLSASILGRILRRGARTVGLGFADRLGGALFGLLRGAGIATAILLAITAFLPTAPWVQNSAIAPYLLHAAHAVSFTMPPDLRIRLRDSLQHLNHGSPDWIKSGPLSHTGFTTLQP